MAAEFVLGAVSLVITQCFPLQLISIFGSEDALYERFAVLAFRIYLCMLPLATVNKGTFIYLQSLGKALTSTLLSLVREIVFGVGFALILPKFFGLDGVLYSMPVSDALTFVISVIVIVCTYKTLKADKGEEQAV